LGSSGFEGKLSGIRNAGGSFVYISVYTNFWSSSISSGNAWSRYLISTEAGVRRNENFQANGFSVRCLLD